MWETEPSNLTHVSGISEEIDTNICNPNSQKYDFHNLSLITEINELFHDILIYWDAPVSVFTGIFNQLNASFLNKSNTFFKKTSCWPQTLKQ